MVWPMYIDTNNVIDKLVQFTDSSKEFQTAELEKKGFSGAKIRETQLLARSIGLNVNTDKTDGPEASHFGINKLYLTFENLKDLDYPLEDFYKLNSYGNRSDEFTDIHNGKHILFAGCSVTFGEAMFLEYTWAKKLYNKIAKDTNTSGYFNVGWVGASSEQIISQILKYTDKFSMPDYIFVLLPNPERDMKIVRPPRVPGSLARPPIGPENYENIHEKYEKLEEFCKENNIKIFFSSWDLSEKPHYDPRTSIKNYYKIPIDSMAKHLYNFVSNSSKHEYSKFITTALDAEHPGIAFHDYYADFFYQIYKDNK